MVLITLRPQEATMPTKPPADDEPITKHTVPPRGPQSAPAPDTAEGGAAHKAFIRSMYPDLKDEA